MSSLRRALLCCLAAAPVLALAQGGPYGLPSIGEAFRQMDRLHALGARPGLALDLSPPAPLAQTFVLPERPGQNQVAWYDFDWEHLDVPSPSGGKGGVRLYYYRRERPIAELALPVIRAAYLRLVEDFHYTPTQQIPYILYASRREFQATNVFEVGESVLGVTSPRDLKMSLPYFGDHTLFREVSTHELVHQFTIQKLNDLAGGDDGSAVDALPLWFVEGLAEYYAKGGLDDEADLYLRDLVWNPDPEHHYQVLGFADDRYRGYIPTYKLGQARVAFVAEVYGKERLQGFLEGAATGGNGGGERGFATLVARVLGERLDEVDARWKAWIRQRYYPQYLAVRQDLSRVREVRDLPGEPEAFAASPDGRVLLLRGIDREQGRARLFLVDAAQPRTSVEIAADNRPGIESLHPIEHSVMAVSLDSLAFSAQSGAGDVLYVQSYAFVPGAAGKPSALTVGERRGLTIVHPEGRRFLEIWDPAFSPDGRQLAFAGVTDAGQQDVYVVPVEGGTARQLTDDAYAERDLAWGAGGIYCTSDATDHGRLNLFRLDPATGARTRLTTGPHDDRQPRPLRDGAVLFAGGATGKPDLYVLRDGERRRLTDFSTGLGGPAPSPGDRGIWATTFNGGRFRLVEVPRVAWLDGPALPVLAPAGGPLPIPREQLPGGSEPYQPYALSNWRPEAGMIYGGGASYGVAGSAAMLFADTLRDHLLFANLAIYGSFDYTQVLLLFEDRSARTAWALGAYHFVLEQLDRENPSLAYLQRDFGVVGTLRFPVDRFMRWEAELSVGAVQRYCPTLYTSAAPVTCDGASLVAGPAWEAANGGPTPQLGPTFRYGYDTVQYDLRAGPIAGQALLLEVGGGWLPWRNAVHGFARFDATSYLRLIGRSKLMLRAAAATSFAPGEGKNWVRTWWLSSADNLRGYGPFDLAYLIGEHYYVANAELQIPLDWLVRLAFFDNVSAVAAMDFGGVFNHWDSRPGCTPQDPTCLGANLGPWEARTLTGVLGFNVLFGPLLLRVHFGHPFDIGGIRTPALQSGTAWVTNITLRYFFF